MFALKHRTKSIKTIFAYLLLLLVSWSLFSCSNNLEGKNFSDRLKTEEKIQPNRLSEIAPPAVINQLDAILSKYQPQVSIISPQPDQIFSENSVTVKLDVKDLEIFRDPQFNLGPHLQLILDNERYISVYDLNEPIVLEDLTPGTHTLRVFAVKPWLESFKNEGAYAQTVFHIYTKTDNTPSPFLPLLTYNSPQGTYGAEPIMLDFYLTNAPLHLVARQNPDDEINDWRIRVTINDESFLLDSWKPVYLTGFQPGINWVKLEFIDEHGEKINNLYNTSVHLVDYQPGGEDSLSQLIRGELSLDTVKSIVDPNYLAPVITTPQTTPEAEVRENPSETTETVETTPETDNLLEEVTETPQTTPETSETLETTPEEQVTEIPENNLEPEVTETPAATIPEVETSETPQPAIKTIPLQFNQEFKIKPLTNSELEKMLQQIDS